MRLSLQQLGRPTAVLCVLLVLTGCTKRVVIGLDQLERGEHSDKTYVVHVRDGREIVSDHVTFADSAVVLHNVIVEGKRRVIEPDSIPVGTIERAERVETNWPITVLVLAPIVFVGVLMAWFLLDSGGGFEGQGD